MRNDMRYVFGGAAVGAIVGALLGWLVGRASEGDANLPGVDKGRAMRLGWAVIGVVRQILELG